MPFDGTDYTPREPPRRHAPSGNALCWAIAILATLMLAMPVSVAALADIVSFLARH